MWVQGVCLKHAAHSLGYHGPEEICHRNNICMVITTHEDSDYEHETPDGPSRAVTPPVHLTSPGSSGAGGQAATNGGAAAAAQQYQQQQDQQQQGVVLQPQAVVPADDISARLAVLHNR